ncbi:MAG: hypothetical protein QM758_05865 [Armatimonas sp.]
MKRSLLLLSALLILAPACMGQGLPKLHQLPWDYEPHPVLVDDTEEYGTQIGMSTYLRFGRVNYVSNTKELVEGNGRLTFHGLWSTWPRKISLPEESKRVVLTLEGYPEQTLETEREVRVVFLPSEAKVIKGIFTKMLKVTRDKKRFKSPPVLDQEMVLTQEVHGVTFSLARLKDRRFKDGHLAIFVQDPKNEVTISLHWMEELPFIIRDLDSIQSWLSQQKLKTEPMRLELPYTRVHDDVREYVPRNK